MVRFQVISDIHLEFYSHNINKVIKEIKTTGKYLLLAGDIGYPHKTHYSDFIKIMSERYQKVFLIAGNHEYYQQWNKNEPYSIFDVKKQIMKVVEPFKNIHFLDNSYYDFEDIAENGISRKFRILGSTFWFYPENNEKLLSDYYNIYLDEEHYLTNITNKYIENEWNIAKEFIKNNLSQEMDNIVMTHHLPSYQMINPEYLTEKYKKYNFYFASNSDELIKNPIKAWICGHSHGFNEMNINGVKCVLNAYGYKNEKDKLKSDLSYYFEL